MERSIAESIAVFLLRGAVRDTCAPAKCIFCVSERSCSTELILLTRGATGLPAIVAKRQLPAAFVLACFL
ncbi:unnamed protein product [Toxocara canis]|uniref:Secreted protein n=1 Tax=Toxocara canis TaxID=6265 RepID=A0A183UYP2_TOXCA|nr:unnamed protein product [Toxocara canis]